MLQWSFKCLLSNRFPAARHDGAAFLANDGCRKKRQLQPIGLLAVLCELKADSSSSTMQAWHCCLDIMVYLLGLLKFVKLRFR